MRRVCRAVQAASRWVPLGGLRFARPVPPEAPEVDVFVRNTDQLVREVVRARKHNRGAEVPRGVRLAFQTEAMKFRRQHVSATSITTLRTLLRTCTTLGNIAGVAHVASITLSEVVRRIPEMNAFQLTRLLLVVVDPSRPERRDVAGLPARERADMLGAGVRQLLSAPEALATVPLPKLTMLLSSALADDAVPDGLCYELLQVIMPVANTRKHELGIRQITVLCHSVCRLRYADTSAVDFFVDAADVVARNSLLLNGAQVGFILDAFARVKYFDAKVFLTLGQRAGDLGEELSVSDVARILNAFQASGIDHSPLRRTLESAQRMKRAW